MYKTKKKKKTFSTPDTCESSILNYYSLYKPHLNDWNILHDGGGRLVFLTQPEDGGAKKAGSIN